MKCLLKTLLGILSISVKATELKKSGLVSMRCGSKADVNAVIDNDKTALTLAKTRQHKEVIEALIEAGAY